MALTIRSVEEAARAAHDPKTNEGWNAFVLYSNGAITSQKGGELLWARSEFTKMAPICRSNIIRLPCSHGPNDEPKSFAYMTEENAVKIRSMMKSLYGLGDAPEPDACGRMLGCTVENPIYQES